MRKKDSNSHARSRVLALVDELNVSSCVRTAGRGLDWLKLRDFLAVPNTARDLIEMVIYAGLPPVTVVSPCSCRDYHGKGRWTAKMMRRLHKIRANFDNKR